MKLWFEGIGDGALARGGGERQGGQAGKTRGCSQKRQSLESPPVLLPAHMLQTMMKRELVRAREVNMKLAARLDDLEQELQMYRGGAPAQAPARPQGRSFLRRDRGEE